MGNPQGRDPEEGCDYNFESERRNSIIPNGLDILCGVASLGYYLVQGVKYVSRIPRRIGDSLVRKAFGEIGGLEDGDLD
ncbi:MAG: hypothetical protein WC494_00210 [Candidatus Pacearchaeota archaeon]